MHRVLSEIKKVKQSSSGPNERNRRLAVGKFHINDESKEDPAHVGVFFSSKMGKGGDSLHKQSHVEIWRETFASSIKHQQNGQILFSCFSCLFSAFLSLFAYFSTSISYVPNFYKLIRHLQWGIRLCLAGGKIS